MQPTAPLDTPSLHGTHRVSPVLISALKETVEILSQTVRSRRSQHIGHQLSSSPISWGSSEAWSLEKEDERQLMKRERLLNPCRGDYGRRLAYDNILKKRREHAAALYKTGQPGISVLEQLNDTYLDQAYALKSADPDVTGAFPRASKSSCRCSCLCCTSAERRIPVSLTFLLILLNLLFWTWGMRRTSAQSFRVCNMSLVQNMCLVQCGRSICDHSAEQ